MLFTIPRGGNNQPPLRYLHTGDFRATPAHTTHPSITSALPLDLLYLDTTYCQPHHVFPAQSTVIDETVRLCTELVGRQGERGCVDLRWLLQRREVRERVRRVGRREREAAMVRKTNGSIVEWMRSGRVTRSAVEVESAIAVEVGGVDVAGDSNEVMEEEEEEIMAPLDPTAHRRCRTLIVVGAYLIGKERVFTGMLKPEFEWDTMCLSSHSHLHAPPHPAIAEALNCKIYADARKRRILACQNNPVLERLITDDPWSTCLHVVQMRDLQPTVWRDCGWQGAVCFIWATSDMFTCSHTHTGHG